MSNALAAIKPIRIQCGDTLTYPNNSYSVVYMNEYSNELVLFEKDTTRLYGFKYPVSAVLSDIRAGKAKVCPGIEAIVPNPENKTYQKHLALINAVESVYGPTFLGLVGRKTKAALYEIIEQSGMSIATCWNVIRKYVQSSCRKSALYPAINRERKLDPQRPYLRRGRKAEEDYLQSEVVVDAVRDIFEEYKEKLLKRHSYSINAAYKDMLGKYFTQYDIVDVNGKKTLKPSLLPANEVPSLRQFYYYFKNTTTQMQRDIAKTSLLEYKNNKRILHSDTFTHAHGPGHICEADHWEIPVKVISKFSNDCVSKPVLSALIDEYSGLPISVNISFDNNSNIALTSMMQVLAESKVGLCARYGVTLEDESLWPSRFYPSILRVDSGSDFLSENTRRFCKENGIELQPVTPGMGSSKPKVERLWGTLDSFLSSHCEGKGYVSGRHGSKPDEEAVLTIDELAKIIYEFIVMYIRSPRENFKVTKDMIEKNVSTSPLGIFEYGCEKFGYPRPITDFANYYYSLLMVDDKAKIYRDGIHSHGLEYIDISNKKLCDQMALAGNKGTPFQVRFDPRNLSCVYYIQDDNLVVVPLKNTLEMQSFKDLSLYELKEYRRTRGKQARLGKAYKLEYQVTTSLSTNATIHQAQLAQKIKPGTKDIKGNRMINKIHKQKDHSIANDINNLKSNPPTTPVVVQISDSNDTPTTPVDYLPEPKLDTQSQDNTVNAMKEARKMMDSGED